VPPLLPALAGAYWLGIFLADRLPAARAAWLWLGLHALWLGLGARATRVALPAAALGSLAAGALALGARLEAAGAVRLGAPVEAGVEGRIGAMARTPGGFEVELRDVRAVAPDAPRLPPALLLRAPADAPGLAARPRGAWVRAALRIAPAPGLRNPGGRDRARALARRGLGASAAALHPELHAGLSEAPPNPLRGLDDFRARGALRLAREGAGGGLLAALGLGEAAALGPVPRAALSRLGLSHLVAVSGLHLWLVAAPLYLAGAALLRRSAALAARRDTRRLALVAAVLGSALYALLTGLAKPVQRALVFLLLLAASQLARRPLAWGNAFGVAALAVAVADPAAPFAPGVQLSFAATAALVWSAPAPEGAAPAGRALLTTALRSSASATALTAPLVALHFGTVSPLGWLANGVGVPLTSLFLLPLALAAGLAAASAAEPEPAVLAGALRLAARVGDAVLSGVSAVAALAPARVGVAPGAHGLVLSCALALACIRMRRTSLRLALALLAAAAPAWGPPPALEPPVPRVVFLDVGQGDAAVVQGRAGALLVDAGPAVASRFDAGERVVLPALGALGVERLDLAVASHADLDHRGGLAAVLRGLPVAKLWLPPGGRAEPAFAELVALARARGVAIEERALGDPPLVAGDLRVETLWPPRAGRPEGRNDASLVLRVEAAGRRVLLPGDLEAAGEAALLAHVPELRADVLKLGHHGSRSSSTARFLAAVAPALAVVSAPRHGRFGMPHPELRARLAEAGLAWRWTGRDGAVGVGLGGTLCVRGFAGEPGSGQAAGGRCAP
jgi:competence protein ComEC